MPYAILVFLSAISRIWLKNFSSRARASLGIVIATTATPSSISNSAPVLAVHVCHIRAKSMGRNMGKIRRVKKSNVKTVIS